MKFVNQEGRYTVPEFSLRFAHAKFSLPNTRPFSAGQVELAELVFDSARQGPGTATRAGAHSARQLLYRSGSVCIDMHRFNDTFGHDAGDMVLQSLADLFRTFFRGTDLCCRYGGEEFAIILPESSSQDAAIRAEALRSEVKRLRLQYKKQTLGPLTLLK